MAAPEITQAGQAVSLQRVALPDGIVGILDRQGRQGRRLTRQSGLIKRRQFADHDTDGPAVRDDMVLGKQQHMLLIGQLQQLAADQRALSQIERGANLIFGQFGHATGPGRFVQGAQIQTGECKTGVGGSNLLAGLTVNQRKVGTQARLAGDQVIERHGEGLRVKLTGKLQYRGNMVGQAGSGIELVEEPQSLLGKREWQGHFAIGNRDNSLVDDGGIRKCLSEVNQDRLGKELSQRQLQS